jgi:hypothetical protein
LEELQKIETEEAPVIKWKSPEVGWFKENWDVALDRTTKCMGIGIIIRDHWEMVNAALAQPWRHIKRGANGVAHGLAKLATKEPIDQFWMEDIPNCIFYVVSQELHALFM